MTFDQAEFAVRCEWGEHGVRLLAPISDVVIIVDVLSFSTCVDIATARGATVFPWRWKDESAQAFAAAKQAALAGSRETLGSFSLSPASVLAIPAATRLVLPSPNGAALSLATGETPTLAGCLRNCQAVAQAARRLGERVAVIPAGERWEDGSMRPAWEDFIGAGALIFYLCETSSQAMRLSPEAHAALVAYEAARAELVTQLKQCSSGKELIERGFMRDVAIAAELNASSSVPLLSEQAFIHQTL